MVAVNIANALKNAVVKEDGSLNLDGISEIGKFIASFTPVDWLIDLYDLGESILTFDWSWDGTGNILSNGVGFIPWVGNFIKGFKAGRKTVKVVDVAADVTESLNDASKAIRRTDVILDAGKEVKNVGHGAEAFIDASKTAVTFNKASNAVDTVSDARKIFESTTDITENSVLEH